MSTTLEEAKTLAGGYQNWIDVLKVAETLTETDPALTDPNIEYNNRVLIVLVVIAILLEVTIGVNLKNPQLVQSLLHLLSKPVPSFQGSEVPPRLPIPIDPGIYLFDETQMA